MNIKSDERAVWWENGLNVDADGSPNAYGPNGGLDYLANAGGPGNWYGLVVDANGQPVVQGPNDPFPGQYVSTTALVDKSKPAHDPARYVNSSKIPYLSIPSNSIRDFGMHLGDVGFAYNRKSGQMCAFIVADVGPKNKYGEGSMALCEALGLSGSPKHGGASSGIVCVVFKGTNEGWPRKNADVAQKVQDILNANGGADYYNTLIAP